jgi:hypothetical protein
MEYLDDALLDTLVDYAHARAVLIEEPPTMFRHDLAAAVYYYICTWTEKKSIKLVRVNPGQWKKMITPVRVSSKHQEDAATMAKWFVKSDLYKRLLEEVVGQ